MVCAGTHRISTVHNGVVLVCLKLISLSPTCTNGVVLVDTLVCVCRVATAVAREVVVEAATAWLATNCSTLAALAATVPLDSKSCVLLR